MRNRICLALALLSALAGSPQPAQSQSRTSSVLERKVTVTFSQAPLESVLQTLRREYRVRISYSNTSLNLRQPVTLSVQNQPLRTVLTAVLLDKNIGYELVGDQVVLHRVRPAKPKSAPVDTALPSPASKTPGSTSDAPAVSPPSSKAAARGKAPSFKPTPAKPAVSRTSKTGGLRAAEKSGTQLVKPTGPAVAPAVRDTVAVKPTPAPDTTAKPGVAEPANPAHPTRTRQAQVSFLGPLGSNGLRSGQTVNKLSVNVLGGNSAGVDGFEAAGLFNVTRDSVRGVQLAGLANVVGRHLNGFQGAGLLNMLGGPGTGWQAAGLLNVATRPVSGVQTAGLFNYNGVAKKTDAAPAEAIAAHAPPTRKTVQAAGLFNASPGEVRGVQAAGLFNVAGTVHGVQLAGLLNIADSVDGVSIAPLNFVRRGYHRFEAVNSESWPVGASLKLGGSSGFYTFFAGAYDGFGSGNGRWALGYGAGTELLARRRISLTLDAVALHVNEESRGWTEVLNLHNQLRLLVGFAPFKAGGHLRLVAGPTVSVLVTQHYDTERGQVYSGLVQNRSLWLDEKGSKTSVFGWIGYCAGICF